MIERSWRKLEKKVDKKELLKRREAIKTRWMVRIDEDLTMEERMDNSEEGKGGRKKREGSKNG